MFFIDPEKETEERFDMGRFFRITDILDVMDSYILDQLKSLPVGGTYPVGAFAGKPDQISKAIYRSFQYWWVILFFNDIALIRDLTPNTELVWPALADLEELYLQLRKQAVAAGVEL